MCRTRILCHVIVLSLLLSPAQIFAQGSHITAQRVDAVIAPDLSVRGRWSIPVSTADTDIYIFPEYKEFGFTSAYSYTLVGAENENGPVLFSHEPGDYAYVNTGYQSGQFYRELYLDYAFTPAFKSPFVLYEFMVFGGGFFFRPTLGITYPDTLSLISSWPPVKETKPADIIYPTESHYVYPVVLLFERHPLPPGVVIRKEGVFKIAGDASSVQRVSNAVRKLAALPDIMQELLDTPLPDEVIIMITDLDAAKLNFEAAGLAVRPNIMLLNRAFLEKLNETDLSLLIAHETTHLSEMGKSLFTGAPYIAPWFREGIATAVEIETRNRLLASRDEQIRYDILGSFNTHLFSANELQQKYTKDFDFFLNGAHAFPVTSSYAHGALVLRHLYKEKGRAGMKDLFGRLRTAVSSQQCDECDSNTIVEAMRAITGWSRDDVLSPYQKDTAQALMSGLIQTKRGDDEEDRLILEHVQKVPQYFTETGVNERPTVPAAAAPVQERKTETPEIVAPPKPVSAAKLEKQTATGTPTMNAAKTPSLPKLEKQTATGTPTVKAAKTPSLTKAAPTALREQKKEQKRSFFQKFRDLFRKNRK